MLFDTHAHYYDQAFDGERDSILAALPENGVELVLCPGCDLNSSQAAIALAEQYPYVYAAVGIHPEDALNLPPDWLQQIEALSRHPKVKAIGEIGLDYYWKEVPKDLQKEVFRAQLALAQRLDLPVIVHDREAHGDCLAMVREFPGVRGVFHCYSGSAEDAKTLVALGWHLSFTGTITFKNARKAPEVVAAVPMTPPTWPPPPSGGSAATPAMSTAWRRPSGRSRACRWRRWPASPRRTGNASLPLTEPAETEKRRKHHARGYHHL